MLGEWGGWRVEGLVVVKGAGLFPEGRVSESGKLKADSTATGCSVPYCPPKMFV